jgi:hypothetical protein
MRAVLTAILQTALPHQEWESGAILLKNNETGIFDVASSVGLHKNSG